MASSHNYRSKLPLFRLSVKVSYDAHIDTTRTKQTTPAVSTEDIIIYTRIYIDQLTPH